MLFRSETVALVTDFGFMNQRPRIDDLALTLSHTLWQLHAADQPNPLGHLVQLVDAYEMGTERLLREVELRGQFFPQTAER